ncbi:MAG: UDP-glucose/GDP-mannose dehydrogenase family protein [Chitinophagales bacterium]|nr:UDP-glucose/GDP-mannose dehydrogenase family protein [Bacteroidota bacterium]MCB9043167.1 UDP-glucose/GDP-mannose dehydrogenase family protein [Chitinophagales bacterium]
MNIAVIGTGYVGLVTGTCFAETGNQVTCVDIDQKKIDLLNAGGIPIYEPGLDTLLERNRKQGRIKFTTSLEEGINDALIVFLALPTPPGEDGSADLSYVLKASEQIGKLLKEYKVIVNKSTVPVGTAEKVSDVLQKVTQIPFDVVSNPEFLREGVAVEDFLKPDRVVVGTRSEKARNIMSTLYEPFVRQGNPIYFMDERSSELTKYAANAYLATRISFMNEMANVCEATGANVDMVRLGMGSDSRIGKRFLFPGVGYGGSCFPKDVLAMVHTSTDYDYDFKILKSVINVNQRQRERMLEKILAYFGNDVQGKKIAIWGLAFKPNTDDIREAPALFIIKGLLEKGAKIAVFDPEAMENVKNIFPNEISYAENMYEVLPNADALCILTEWNVFRTPDFGKMEKIMNRKLVFDGRNVYKLEQMQELGFEYVSIGRKTIK